MQENKRLNNDADKQKLVKLQQDLFDDEKQVAKTLRENFRFTNKIETLNNISCRNNIAEEVSINVRKKLNKTSEYEVGEVLLCKKFIKTKAYRKLKNDKGVKKIGKYNLNNNCKYEIVENNGDLITLKETHYDFVELSTIDEDDDITIIKNKGESAMISYDVFVELPRQMIEQRFIYNYCRTGHSLQGVTLKEKMTVFDHRFLERDQDKLRKWIWVAVTRATSFDQVLIFGGGDVEFNDQLWQMYMKDKITQYKNQDKKAGRGINAESYITTEWLDNAVTGICYFCHNSFDLSFKGCKVDCNLTADRIDDTLGHELNNIRACCNYCNTRKLK